MIVEKAHAEKLINGLAKYDWKKIASFFFLKM